MPLVGKQYEYEALKTAASIRLLRILADDESAPIRTQLHETSLENDTEHVALSYVWGNEVHRYEIYVGSCILRIGRNLFEALRRMRKRATTTAWVDAICINQKTNQERSKQIMLMRRIYESASCTLVDLGAANNCVQTWKLLYDIHQFGQENLIKPEQNGGHVDLRLSWVDLAQLGLPDLGSPEWEPLIRLLEHPWFTRVWIFQEVLVSKRCSFFFGDCVLDRELFFATLYIMQRCDFADYIDQVARNEASPMKMSIQRCMSVFWLQRANFLRPNEQTWKRSPLIRLLLENEGSKATDPHDHVFALLGVSQEVNEPALEPDYSESPNQTYLRVAKYFVEKSYGPQLLGRAGLSNSASNLPSWVPVWNIPSSSRVFSWPIGSTTPTREVFRATRQSTPSFRFLNSSHTLVVRGAFIDTVEMLGTSRFVLKSVKDFENAADTNEMIVTCLAEIIAMSQHSQNFCARGKELAEMVCRLSVCDIQLHQMRKISENYQKGLRAFIGIVFGTYIRGKDVSFEYRNDATIVLSVVMTGQFPEDTTQYKKLAVLYSDTARYRFLYHIRCLTQKGYICQVPPEAQVGDKIAIVQGCNVPYLLRPVGTNQYLLLSNCYVHGIMYGEALDEGDTEIGDIKIV